MAKHVNARAEDDLNMDVRTTDIIRFVATGSRDSYSLMVSSHFIVDQGSYVLWDQTGTRCVRDHRGRTTGDGRRRHCAGCSSPSPVARPPSPVVTPPAA